MSNREIELETGEVITGITRVTEGEVEGTVHIHTPGKGYRIAERDDIVRDEQSNRWGR